MFSTMTSTSTSTSLTMMTTTTMMLVLTTLAWLQGQCPTMAFSLSPLAAAVATSSRSQTLLRPPPPSSTRRPWTFTTTTSTTTLWGISAATSFPQRPGESSFEYFKRLAKLASDPRLLEQAVQQQSQQQQQQQQQSSKNSSSSSSSSSSSTAQRATARDDNDEQTQPSQPQPPQPQPQRRTAYVRAEEWDKAQHAKVRQGMSWDERVQHDGLRFGNGVQQHDILRRTLNGF